MFVPPSITGPAHPFKMVARPVFTPVRAPGFTPVSSAFAAARLITSNKDLVRQEGEIRMVPAPR